MIKLCMACRSTVRYNQHFKAYICLQCGDKTHCEETRGGAELVVTYPFRVYLLACEDEVLWVAQSDSLRGCIGQGQTVELAIRELMTNEVEWLTAASEYDFDIPLIPVCY